MGYVVTNMVAGKPGDVLRDPSAYSNLPLFLEQKFVARVPPGLEPKFREQVRRSGNPIALISILLPADCQPDTAAARAAQGDHPENAQEAPEAAESAGAKEPADMTKRELTELLEAVGQTVNKKATKAELLEALAGLAETETDAEAQE